MSKKIHAFEYFKKFRYMIEKQTGKHIKFFAPIKVDNTGRTNLPSIVKTMEYYSNSQCPTLLSRTE